MFNDAYSGWWGFGWQEVAASKELTQLKNSSPAPRTSQMVAETTFLSRRTGWPGAAFVRESRLRDPPCPTFLPSRVAVARMPPLRRRSKGCSPTPALPRRRGDLTDTSSQPGSRETDDAHGPGVNAERRRGAQARRQLSPSERRRSRWLRARHGAHAQRPSGSRRGCEAPRRRAWRRHRASCHPVGGGLCAGGPPEREPPPPARAVERHERPRRVPERRRPDASAGADSAGVRPSPPHAPPASRGRTSRDTPPLAFAGTHTGERFAGKTPAGPWIQRIAQLEQIPASRSEARACHKVFENANLPDRHEPRDRSAAIGHLDRRPTLDFP